MRMRQFLNELAQAVPNAVKVNRGRSSLDELALKALKYGARYVVLFTDFHGNPSSMRFFKVGEGGLTKIPYIATLSGVKLLIDMFTGRPNLPKPRDMAIVSYLRGSPEFIDLLAEVFNADTYQGGDLGYYRLYDTVMLIKPSRGLCCEIGFIHGPTQAPRGPILRVRSFKALDLLKKATRGG